MDNITDLFDKRRFKEPDESQIIKDYVMTKYNSSCTVTVQDHQIVVAVSSAALAGNLRMDLDKLKTKLNSAKSIKIYIN
jgi:hypothetical protein